jgi:kumamolisin
MATVTLPGSERRAMPGTRKLGLADPTERLEVSVLLRRKAAAELRDRAASLNAGETPAAMSREDFAKTHGAQVEDCRAVRDFAAAHGLVVVQEDVGRRTIVLSGTVAQFSAAFAVQLHRMEHDGGTFRGRSGAITLPSDLAPCVEAVLGLDNRPQAKPQFRLRPSAQKTGRQVRRPRAAAVSYTPLKLATLYGFPAGSGAGQCVAIIELGGGYRPADLAAYFTSLKVKTPKVVAVSVDQAKNAPTGEGNGPDGEVMLDIEVVGAIAPSATIAVYFAPNTDAGFLDAITTAIHDTSNKPSVISISWGGPESSWTAQAMTAMDDAFQTAATLGITVCVAAGDNGSSDGVASGDHVDFPASSAFALACGGTSLQAGTAIQSETVWNDGAQGGSTGGGVSTMFALPTWQKGLQTTGSSGKAKALKKRGVPDVAGDADPETGYVVRVDGSNTVIGGTSAVAPLWAGLIARINGIAGKPAGFINPTLYANPQALRDITAGNNGDFAAAAGWDACTGLGSPNGTAVAGLFTSAKGSFAKLR